MPDYKRITFYEVETRGDDITSSVQSRRVALGEVNFGVNPRLAHY